MDFRKLALLVGALMVAAISAVLARGLLAGGTDTAEATPQPGIEVLVAAQTLPIGTMIDPSMIRFQPWPQDMVDGAYILRAQGDPQTLKGQVVRYAIAAGQPVTQGALIKPGDRGFLAAALGPGMRAVTVSVNASTGVAGFVFPGDRVDVVLTQQVAGGGSGEPLKVAETIIRNIRVLATDQRTSSEPAEGEDATARLSNTVTLEATPAISEKIAVAQTIGQLSLSLRSITDNVAELEAAIAAGDVEIPEGTDAKGEKRILLALAARPNDTKGTFSTGGDVSRFQRTSVPALGDDGSLSPERKEAQRLSDQLTLRNLRKQLADEKKSASSVTVRRGASTNEEDASGNLDRLSSATLSPYARALGNPMSGGRN